MIWERGPFSPFMKRRSYISSSNGGRPSYKFSGCSCGYPFFLLSCRSSRLIITENPLSLGCSLFSFGNAVFLLARQGALSSSSIRWWTPFFSPFSHRPSPPLAGHYTTSFGAGDIFLFFFLFRLQILHPLSLQALGKCDFLGHFMSRVHSLLLC